jgi:DNA-binding transcriptional ArsR family regulator
MAKETKGEKTKPPEPKRVFDGEFFKFWHFTRVLTEEQRQTLSSTLSRTEQQELITSYKKGGWKYLFMRNACDEVLDRIEKKFGVHWLSVRSKIIGGKPQLIQRSFWEYLNECFEGQDWEHIAYIFDGLIARDYDADYVKVCLFVPPKFIEDDGEENDPTDTKGE